MLIHPVRRGFRANDWDQEDAPCDFTSCEGTVQVPPAVYDQVTDCLFFVFFLFVD